ncbi:MAG TPA: cytochrome c [Micropepsaceae bacterium]|jgi:cytochrome c|nr:cytochrome c [Micropepsaceae bacterium]
MRCSFKVLASAAILAVPVAALAASPTYNVGTPLSQAEIQNFDRIIGPEGKELPAGRGTSKEGAVIFAQRCEVCHGKNGENGIVRRLVVGKPGQPYRGNFYGQEANGPSYYPYPTITWDYINRAMPASNPGSLKPDEVYALVAFLYYRNGIIKEDEVMDRNTLPKVEMPNKNGFVPAKPVYPIDPKQPSWY